MRCKKGVGILVFSIGVVDVPTGRLPTVLVGVGIDLDFAGVGIDEFLLFGEDQEVVVHDLFAIDGGLAYDLLVDALDLLVNLLYDLARSRWPLGFLENPFAD